MSRPPRLSSVWGKVYQLLLPRARKQLLSLGVLMVGGAGFEAVGLSAIPAFIVLLQDPQRVMASSICQQVVGWTGFTDPQQFTLYAGLALLALFIVKNAYLTALTFVRVRYVRAQGVDISTRLFNSYLYAPYEFISSHNSSKLLRNVNSEVQQMVQNVLLPGISLMLEVAVIVALASVLFIAEPTISISVVTILLSIGLIFNVSINKKLREMSKLQQVIRAESIKFIQEGIGGVVDARILGRTNFFSNNYKTTATEFARTLAYKSIIVDLPRRIYETTMIVGIISIGLFFALGDRNSEELLPVLALFGFAAIRLIPAANMITRSLANIKFYYPSAELVYTDLKRFQDGIPKSGTQKRDAYSMERDVQFQDVTFSYPNSSKPALSSVSLAIGRGEAVGFVGASGAGKSTAASLLLGLLTPTSGQIMVDGEPMPEVLEEWRRSLGYVSQRVYLTDGTLRANIAFGRSEEETDEDAVWRALELAQLDAFVRTLHKGLDTRVGEAGVRLSGGQRQRIAIARALYTDPAVLLFDEATAALDNQTERGLIEAIERLRGSRTIITIAHRLSTVQACDRIFVFSDGEVVASGSYDELLSADPTFQSLALQD